MKNKRIVLSCLVILLTGVIYFAIQALQKNGTHSANFSGEWKSKESISMGGNIVCCYNSGDRMLAKTMKIAEQGNFLTNRGIKLVSWHSAGYKPGETDLRR